MDLLKLQVLSLCFRELSLLQREGGLVRGRTSGFKTYFYAYPAREIGEGELNDWSDSVLTPDQIKYGKKYRIKCLDF